MKINKSHLVNLYVINGKIVLEFPSNFQSELVFTKVRLFYENIIIPQSKCPISYVWYIPKLWERELDNQFCKSINFSEILTRTFRKREKVPVFAENTMGELFGRSNQIEVVVRVFVSDTVFANCGYWSNYNEPAYDQ